MRTLHKQNADFTQLLTQDETIPGSGIIRRVGGTVPPRLLTGKFLLTYREMRGKDKRENGAERRKIEKKKVENWKWKEEKVIKWGEDFFCVFFVFVFVLFCFVFFFAFHFSKPLKSVLGQLKWEFSTRKRHFTPGKNQEKLLCPLLKVFLWSPWSLVFVLVPTPLLT